MAWHTVYPISCIVYIVRLYYAVHGMYGTAHGNYHADERWQAALSAHLKRCGEVAEVHILADEARVSL